MIPGSELIVVTGGSQAGQFHAVPGLSTWNMGSSRGQFHHQTPFQHGHFLKRQVLGDSAVNITDLWRVYLRFVLQHGRFLQRISQRPPLK